MRFNYRLIILSTSLLTPVLAAEPFVIRDSEIATHETTGVRIVKGTLEYPKSLEWNLDHFATHDGLTDIQFESTEVSPDAEEGSRLAKLLDRRAISDRRNELWQTYYQCRNHAEEHGGTGPKSLAELAQEEEGDEKPVFLHPAVPMLRKQEKSDYMTPVKERAPLLVDLAPAIADGKHWIFDNRGNAERVEIDAALLEKLGVRLEPQAQPHGNRDVAATEQGAIYARVTGSPEKAVIPVRNTETGEALRIEWDLSEAKKGDPTICQEWAAERFWSLSPYLKRDAPLSVTWAERTIAQYALTEMVGDEFPELLDNGGDERFRGNTTDIMGMLGGRAAIKETLQLRNLRSHAEKEEDWMPSIPIDKVEGVQVQAHPFEKMLGDEPGGRLPLADWIPHDQFMVYLPQPERIFSLLGGGKDFLFQAGAGATGRSASYQVQERYQEAFGLSEELMKRFLKTGAIEEMALTMPDLFLIDGTEMAVVMRTGKPLLTTTALALVGIPPGDGQTVKKNRRGEPVYWVRQGDILIVGTNQGLVEASLKAKKEDTGLGKSAELRYMLTQVPLRDETVVFTYFSDPFIRHLVGPRTKIGQLRRLLARAELEEATAGSLLATFDGHGERAAQLPFLQEKGYMRRPVYAADLELDGEAQSRSGFYGTPARMSSLLDQPIDKVSPQEKKAYDTYLGEYNRFWRRYFDPIAIRYDRYEDGRHELETFILPLIENSLYGGLRQFLPGQEEQLPLRVPIIEPAPIALVSANMREEAWLEALEGMTEIFESTLGLDGSLLDLIGPDVHLALQDADPIITLGNGELQGMLGSFGGDGDEMVWLTALVSILTRPCTIHVGLTDPDRVRKLLTEMSWPPLDDLGGIGEGSLYQVTGKDKWIYKYSLEGVITLRFGIEVQDRFLVINNQPFSNDIKVTGHRPAPNGAAYLELNPGACVKQLPALFTSAAEGMRRNATSGAACLVPLVLLGSDVEEATARHRKLFGFAPIHPGGGSWSWDGMEGGMVSSLYGGPWDHRQPDFDPDNDQIGLLQGVSHVRIGMQFEQDGLRSTVGWSVKGKE